MQHIFGGNLLLILGLTYIHLSSSLNLRLVLNLMVKNMYTYYMALFIAITTYL